MLDRLRFNTEELLYFQRLATFGGGKKEAAEDSGHDTAKTKLETQPARLTESGVPGRIPSEEIDRIATPSLEELGRSPTPGRN